MCAQNRKGVGNTLCCLLCSHSSLELRAPLPLRGRAGRGWGRCRERRDPSGSWSWSWSGRSGHRYRTDRATNAAQGPNFGLSRFRACTARTLQRDNGADPRCRRCRDSQRQRPLRPAMKSCPEPARCLGAAGEGGRWFIREHRGSLPDLPSPRVLCSWKAFSQPAHADQCVLVPIPEASREVTSLRNAAVSGLSVMQEHYLLVNCNTVLKILNGAGKRKFRLAYFTSFGLISLCIIIVLHCLVLKASLRCAWDLPQCFLQRWPSPSHPWPSPPCAQLFPLEQTDSVPPGTLVRHGQFWTPSAHQFRHVYLPT